MIHRNTKHGMHKARIYRIWRDKKAYAKYRNIFIANKWLTFTGFFEDMGNPPDHYRLHRIDKTKGFCKENCVWSEHPTYNHISDQDLCKAIRDVLNKMDHKTFKSVAAEIGIPYHSFMRFINGICCSKSNYDKIIGFINE